MRYATNIEVRRIFRMRYAAWRHDLHRKQHGTRETNASLGALGRRVARIPEPTRVSVEPNSARRTLAFRCVIKELKPSESPQEGFTFAASASPALFLNVVQRSSQLRTAVIYGRVFLLLQQPWGGDKNRSTLKEDSSRVRNLVLIGNNNLY